MIISIKYGSASIFIKCRLHNLFESMRVVLWLVRLRVREECRALGWFQSILREVVSVHFFSHFLDWRQ
jgi:hypothetical protein